LRGLLRVEHGGGVLDVRAGEGVVIRAGKRVRSDAPESMGTEYLIIYLLGFPRQVGHRSRE
jgi:hypothetical protein